MERGKNIYLGVYMSNYDVWRVIENSLVAWSRKIRSIPRQMPSSEGLYKDVSNLRCLKIFASGIPVQNLEKMLSISVLRVYQLSTHKLAFTTWGPTIPSIANTSNGSVKKNLNTTLALYNYSKCSVKIKPSFGGIYSHWDCRMWPIWQRRSDPPLRLWRTEWK